MHPRLALSASALIALLGCANQPDVGGTTQVGKVQGVFVEQYPGVFVDQRVADAGASGKPTWAHVKFAQPLADGRTFATAIVQAGQAVEPGDLVQMRLRRVTPGNVAVVQEHNQVTALIAKYGTAPARRFDEPEDRPLERLTQAGD
jgi:hypothetical protein